MSLDNPTPEPAPVATGRKRGVKIALVSAGLIAGAIGATAFGASAQSSATTSTTSSTAAASAPSGAPSGAPTGAPAAGKGAGLPGGAAPVRSDEKSVDSATAAKLKAAALKAVPGATVIRVETDSGDATYEAHVKKSDGSLVTVKFDKTFAVTGVESGMGK